MNKIYNSKDQKREAYNERRAERRAEERAQRKWSESVVKYLKKRRGK